MDVGLPEQGKEELQDFLTMAKVLVQMQNDCSRDANHMLAKGLAMQQAGILPPNFDLDTMVAQATVQSELEGLLKGY